MRLTRRALGFTLIELAVVILVVTLLLGSVLVPLNTQLRQRNVRRPSAHSRNARSTDRLRHGQWPAASACGLGDQPGGTTSVQYQRRMHRSDSLGGAGHAQDRRMGESDLLQCVDRLLRRHGLHHDHCRNTRCPDPGRGRRFDRSGTGCPGRGLVVRADNYGKTSDGVALTDGSASNDDEDANAANDGGSTFISRTVSENTTAAAGSSTIR